MVEEKKTEDKAVKSDRIVDASITEPVARTKTDVPEKKATRSNVVVGDATPAQVVKVFKKVGLYGECYQVLVRVLDGRDKGNLLRRNVRGPVRENDMLMLKETERDVRAL